MIDSRVNFAEKNYRSNEMSDMRKKKMTWEEMKKRYPNEWLLIVDYDSDESGHLISGIVARHSPEKDDVFRLPSLDQSSAFKYTGKSTFPGGWRTRAKHNNI